MRILAVGHAFPAHYYDQHQLLEALKSVWLREHFNVERLERLHRNVRVGGRHLALPLDEYRQLKTWGQANDAWIRVAQEVGAQALEEALRRAGLRPDQVDVLLTVTVTGVATPSLDARLMNRLPFRLDLKRIPIFGLGCVAGAAGIARAADYVRGYPDQVVALLSVELCSLTVQQEDLSIPNLVATGLFGDGAAAVILAGEKVGDPPDTTAVCEAKILATRSSFYRHTEDVMGWRISEQGFRVILSADVPKMVRDHLRHDVDLFLADHGLTRAEIGTWICHPGGPRVLEVMAETLELPEGALSATWKSLAEVGNLSSTSVLLVLEEMLATPRSGKAVLLAMGPGFCSELVLLELLPRAT